MRINIKLIFHNKIDIQPMKIFFWDFQDDNDIVREWIMFIINLFVLVFTTFALFRTWRYYRQCMFEMMPLSINFIATLILLMLKLFEKGYQFDQIGHLIEIFTYLLFCYTFAIMYTLIKNPDKRKRVQRIWNIILAVFFVLLIIFSVLVFTGVISKKCNSQTQQWPALFGLIFEFLSFLPTVYFGVKILRKMMNKQSKQQSDDQGNLGSFNSQFYIRERKKQITLVLAIYFISLIIRVAISLTMVFFWDDLFQCTQIDNVFIISSQLVFGQIVLIISQINQLLPHIVIPFAMYVVPLQRWSKSSKIDLSKQLLVDDMDDKISEHSQQQNVRNRVSTLVTSRMSDRMSEQNSPRKKNNNLNSSQKLYQK